MKKPRQYSLVRFEFDAPNNQPDPWTPQYKKVGLDSSKVYVFLGEIPNMPGHCVVLNHKSGKIFSGYHIENFKELKEDEV